eukprot:GFKZ01012126.1.p2 GENE.GFKZ01012126.1~~GFKZ01012126.1.p2  ORF type:complete len:275 (+),score=61.90 GFKZ01012126.1:1753-2577(+)
MANMSSDDDDDIFLQGGIPKPSAVPTLSRSDSQSSSSSSSFSPPCPSTPGKKRRGHCGRPSKRGRGGGGSSSTKNSHPIGSVRGARSRGGRKKHSVFDVSSSAEEEEEGGGIEVVDLEDEGGDDAEDEAVRKSLAEARAVLNFQANEERIEKEALESAKREVEARERAMEQEEARKRQRREKEEEDKRKREKQAEVGGTPIELKVQAKGGKSVRMRIRRADALLKVVGPFCDKFGLDNRKAALIVDGEAVGDGETADDYDLEDGMVVEIMIKGG